MGSLNVPLSKKALAVNFARAFSLEYDYFMDKHLFVLRLRLSLSLRTTF